MSSEPGSERPDEAAGRTWPDAASADTPAARPAQPPSDFVPRAMNPLAIVAIVASLLGITFAPVLGSIAGIVCGRIAGKQIDERGEDGAGVAKAAVIIGAVGLGLVLLFVLFIIVLFALASAPGAS